ncbi:big defensin-like [Branchiostoma floridae x Branchiostoma belcheri]
MGLLATLDLGFQRVTVKEKRWRRRRLTSGMMFLVLLVPYTALGAVLSRAREQKREKRAAFVVPEAIY